LKLAYYECITLKQEYNALANANEIVSELLKKYKKNIKQKRRSFYNSAFAAFNVMEFNGKTFIGGGGLARSFLYKRKNRSHRNCRRR
ncbi:MAG: hypothetical protein LBS61_05325, partial [Endomicrobium sp.]|nr:hypothetical protein [Endomicrobium sp.]